MCFVITFIYNFLKKKIVTTLKCLQNACPISAIKIKLQSKYDIFVSIYKFKSKKSNYIYYKTYSLSRKYLFLY